jgi:hypothetical protein
MEAEIIQYFLEEKEAAKLLLAFGVVGIILSGLLLKFGKKNVLIGFSYPTSIISFVLLALGGFLFWRTPTQSENLQLMFLGTPSTFFDLEFIRMEKIITNFTYYGYFELGLMALGFSLCLMAMRTRGFVFGAGLSLFLYGAMMLTFDDVANQRAERYYQSLTKYTELE